MATTAAFEGAEGYGADTVGGRGGAVLKVVNLNDSGEGSLRWALEQSGPRTVVFDVNGTITLKTSIEIKDPYVTIAGQTAPGDGIVIEGARIQVRASETIIRGLTMRPGTDNPGDPVDLDGIYVGAQDKTISHIVIDHSSFEWSVDENLSLIGAVNYVTLSNNIIAEGLSHSIHPDGEHSKGLFLSGATATPDSEITIVRNLLAHNFARNPEVRGGTNVEIVNNYIYDYGYSHLVVSLGNGSGGTLATTVNVVGNVFQPGPSSDTYKQPIAIGSMGAGSAIYLEDNYWTKLAADANGNQAQSKLYWATSTSGQYVVAQSAFGSGVTVLDSATLRDHVLANAGAAPFDRDAIDQAVVDSVLNGGGHIIDSPSQAGGPAPNPPALALADFDGDGMPDWFEDRFGSDPRVFDANGDNDGDGFTNLEEYINGIYTGYNLPPATAEPSYAATDGIAESIVLDTSAFDAGVVIAGFNPGEGDRLDISALLAGYDPLTAPLSDFVRIGEVGGKTLVTVDRDGADAGYVFDFVAEIAGADIPADYSWLVGSYFWLYSPGESLVAGDGFDEIHVVPPADGSTPGPDDQGTLDAGAGNDLIVLRTGGWTGTLEGGAGTDTLAIGSASAADISGLTLSGIETLETNGYVVIATPEQLAQFSRIGFGASSIPKLVLASAGTADLSAALDGRAAIVTGSAGDDDLTLSSGGDTVSAGDGNDIVHAGDGLNVINGGGGDDWLYGGALHDLINAGDGNDHVFGGDAKDEINGGAGDDVLDGGIGNDTLRGGPGSDIYYVDSEGDFVNERQDQPVDDGAIDWVISSANRVLTNFVDNVILVGSLDLYATGNELANRLEGNSGRNVLTGLDGADTLMGGAGDDQLIGGNGDDVLEGGDDNDVLVGGIGADEMHGGSGIDTATYANSNTGVTVAIGGPVGSGGEAAGDTLFEIETIIGSAFNDSLTGDDFDNQLKGGAGADRLTGGGGIDLADYSGSSAAVSVDLGTIKNGFAMGGAGDAKGDQLSGIENLLGSDFADKLFGDGSVNVLTGGAGNDTLLGLGGDDTIIGAAGADRMEGGEGNDWLDGGADKDSLYGGNGNDHLSGGEGDDTFFGDAGDDFLDGGNGNDRLDGGIGADRLEGGSGNDVYTVDDPGDAVIETANGGATDVIYTTISLVLPDYVENLVMNGSEPLWATGNGLANRIVGNGAANVLDGGDQKDTLEGNGGNDTLIGGTGEDKLFGGDDDDSLFGGVGSDSLTGGMGADTLWGGSSKDFFRYAATSESAPSAMDSIADFETTDVIDLSTIDADTGTDGNQAFVFIGSADFTAAGQVRYATASDGNLIVEANIDADLGVDFAVNLGSYAIAINGGDFIL